MVIITKINVNDREWPRIERNLYFLDRHDALSAGERALRRALGRRPARVRKYDHRYVIRPPFFRYIQRKTIIRKFVPIFGTT